MQQNKVSADHCGFVIRLLCFALNSCLELLRCEFSGIHWENSLRSSLLQNWIAPKTSKNCCTIFGPRTFLACQPIWKYKAEMLLISHIPATFLKNNDLKLVWKLHYKCSKIFHDFKIKEIVLWQNWEQLSKAKFLLKQENCQCISG